MSDQPLAKGQVPSEHYNATITYWKDVTDDLAVVRVTPDEGVAPEFKAGQFISLALPREQPPIHGNDDYPPGHPDWKKLWKRPYSIASAQQERGYLEFFIVLNPAGKMTPKLWAIKEGGRVNLGAKAQGEFTVDMVPPGKDLVMVATGTGLSPLLSIVRSHRGTGRWRRCVVIHGSRYQCDLAYHEELTQIGVEDPSVIYVPAITREPNSEWKGFRGRVNTILESDVYEQVVRAPITPDSCHLLLCGNPVMIDEAEQLMTKRGWVTHTRKQPGNLHFERFW